VVGHHYGVIDDYAERHRDAGKRVEMYLQLEEVIEDEGYEDVGNQTDGDDQQIFELPAYG